MFGRRTHLFYQRELPRWGWAGGGGGGGGGGGTRPSAESVTMGALGVCRRRYARVRVRVSGALASSQKYILRPQ